MGGEMLDVAGVLEPGLSVLRGCLLLRLLGLLLDRARRTQGRAGTGAMVNAKQTRPSLRRQKWNTRKLARESPYSLFRALTRLFCRATSTPPASCSVRRRPFSWTLKPRGSCGRGTPSWRSGYGSTSSSKRCDECAAFVYFSRTLCSRYARRCYARLRWTTLDAPPPATSVSFSLIGTNSRLGPLFLQARQIRHNVRHHHKVITQAACHTASFLVFSLAFLQGSSIGSCGRRRT